MLAEVTCVDLKELRFATSKRMLVRVMKLLNVRPKLGRFHKPYVKDGKWSWMLVTRSDDPRRKIPIYFSVDIETMDANLLVTRTRQNKIYTYRLPLPLDLRGANPDEIFKELGFFEEHKVSEVEVHEASETDEVNGNK